ncbi:MAG: aminotransferase class V-fold PLP-dependent enzyme, partial [Clostridia bacterium]|nr:aminotransferase class V-fold PLP-dependent enzyme [Clostridia bacterium]
EAKTAHLTALRDHIMDRLTTEIPYCFINGDRVNRLPNNINVSFEYIEGESILLFMDAKGFALSSGSACTSASLDPSHVLLAMGLKHEQAHGSIRISLGRTNTLEEADLLVDSLVEVVARLRAMSPLYNK